MAGLQKKVLRTVLEVGQRLRVNITPNHFYSDIPDLRTMKRETWWRKPMSMDGVLGAETDGQLAFVRDVCRPYQENMRTGNIHARACKDNGEGGYGPIEADVLYCFVRTFKPKRIVQVGCGVSTSIILHAADDAGYTPEIICIEPYPTSFLTRLASENKITLLAERMQTATRAPFDALEDGDLLFIDSTHTVKPGSEVTRLICEIIPKLGSGVRVHFHDIYFPYDYIPGILEHQVFFWHETVLLHAMLTGSARLRLDVSLSMMTNIFADAAREFLPNYNPSKLVDGLSAGAAGHRPSSVFLRTLAAD